MSADVHAFSVPPVVKRVRIALPVEAAFARFTEGMNGSWPLPSHSVSGNDAVSIAVEPRLGGRLIERDRAGAEHVWGTITKWEPPRALAFSWHAGRRPEEAQTVELRFAEAEAGATEVTLVHSGWERLGADAERIRGAYDSGWDDVLGRAFADAGGTAG